MKRGKKIGIAIGVTAAVGISAAAFLGTALSAWSSGSSTSSSDYSKYEETVNTGDYGYSSYASAGAVSDMYYENDADNSMDADSRVDLSGGDSTDASAVEQKLIVTWSIDMQTEKYEDAVADIKDSIAEAGGYIESEDESSYYDYCRYDYLTIRIPAEKADAWIEGASAYGTIVSRSKSTEDVTLNYVDMQSRLNALRTEQETLMGMMEKADDMSDLIAIQSELTDVYAEIDSYESQLRVMDNQVNYTTINMDIEEVYRESPVQKTFVEEVRERFLNSTENLGNFLRNLAIFILGNSVIILLVIFVIAVIILFTRKMKNRIHKSDNNPEKQSNPDKQPDTNR